MSLPNPAPGDSVAAAHIDSIRTHLEGGSGDTAPYKLRQSTGDFIVVLADNAGASELSIHDSDDIEVAHIDSNGAATVTSLTITNLDIPVSASPSQTADGRAVWDSDDDVLTIGDGASRKTFYPGAPTWEHIDTQITTGTAASVSFASLSATYKVFRLTCFVDLTADCNILLRLNNDTAGNYYYLGLTNAVAAAHAATQTSILLNDTMNFNAGAPSNAFFQVLIAKEIATHKAKIISIMSGQNAGADVVGLTEVAGHWSNVADLINRIDILTSASTFAISSRFTLEGLKMTT